MNVLDTINEPAALRKLARAQLTPLVASGDSTTVAFVTTAIAPESPLGVRSTF